VITKMKSIIRSNLEKKGLSVRGLAEQAKEVPGAPSYSTIDNFIRNGTGNLETAWAITKLMGLTLNDNFVDDVKENEEKQSDVPASASAEEAVKSIIEVINKIGTIKKPEQVAEVLFVIGRAITPLGYDEEAGRVIKMGADFITILNQQGGNGDE